MIGQIQKTGIKYHNLYDFKWGQLFCLWILLYGSISYFTNTLVTTDLFYHASFGSQFSGERIADIIIFSKKLQWISYIELPVLLLIKTLVIAGYLHRYFPF